MDLETSEYLVNRIQINTYDAGKIVIYRNQECRFQVRGDVSKVISMSPR